MAEEALVDDAHNNSAFIVWGFNILYAVSSYGAVYLYIVLVIGDTTQFIGWSIMADLTRPQIYLGYVLGEYSAE